jgi:opacity protein-like surface antigen
LKMMKRILLGACVVVLMAGFATAQTANNNPPPPLPPDQQQADPDDQGQGGWWGGHRGGHHRGDRMRGGLDGGGPAMQAKGFALMVGGGHGLHMNCGEEPMKECIAAAQPLIDSLGKLDFKMPPPPQPPAQ